ncbi:hypothetical protein, partial [Bacillus pumilus]|uniref:hypothetical protein n=1 Tax=Bacillus pumilus TaxID=1408 RepID=UPI001C92FA85
LFNPFSNSVLNCSPYLEALPVSPIDTDPLVEVETDAAAAGLIGEDEPAWEVGEAPFGTTDIPRCDAA